MALHSQEKKENGDKVTSTGAGPASHHSPSPTGHPLNQLYGRTMATFLTSFCDCLIRFKSRPNRYMTSSARDWGRDLCSQRKVFDLPRRMRLIISRSSMDACDSSDGQFPVRGGDSENGLQSEEEEDKEDGEKDGKEEKEEKKEEQSEESKKRKRDEDLDALPAILACVMYIWVWHHLGNGFVEQ